MEYQFSTNSRIIDNIFINYKNTFIAFCELINNSLQAKATKIKIYIAQNTDQVFSGSVMNEIRINDNGIGVSRSEFKKKLLEIGTDVKSGGKGIGRFAVFQLASILYIETVAYDHKIKKYTKTIFQLDGSTLENTSLEDLTLHAEHDELEGEYSAYYQATMREFYDDAITQKDKRKKLNRRLIPENIEEALFLQYPIEILNEKVAFFINGIKIDKHKFLIGDVEIKTEEYIDNQGRSHEMSLSFIHYKSHNRSIRIFFRVDNDNIKTIAHEFEYHKDIPDNDGWLVYVDSPLFNENVDIFRNLAITELDQNAKHFEQGVLQFVDNFFFEKFKEYYNFSKKLKQDIYYPYRNIKSSSGSKTIAFDKLAYFIEKEHNILSSNNDIRRIIYLLADRAINNGDLAPIIDQLASLRDEHISRFRELLEKTDLENVIHFSENVAKKSQFLDFLDDLVYGKPAKYIKERSQLHKIIEKNLWIFGEQYSDTPTLFSDKSLKNNLLGLREKWFDYDPTIGDDNFITVEHDILEGITDLFFFNEKIKDNQKREVMIVELKRPTCKINRKELRQIDEYQYAIEKRGEFSQEVSYKIILISSQVADFARSKVGTRNGDNPFLYQKSKEKDIESWVIKWTDLLHMNRRKMSYLGNMLQTKDHDVREILERDYPGIQISNLTPSFN